MGVFTVGKGIIGFSVYGLSWPKDGGFLQPIRSEKKNSHISIITTNYDLSIDWQFVDELKKNKVDYGISYRNIDSSEITYRDPNPLFRYFKLHGSLNWLRCDLCGNYYINPEGSIVGLAFNGQLQSSFTPLIMPSM